MTTSSPVYFTGLELKTSGLQGVLNELPNFLLPGDRGNRDVFGCLMTKDNKENRQCALQEELICHCLKKGSPMTTSADETRN